MDARCKSPSDQVDTQLLSLSSCLSPVTSHPSSLTTYLSPLDHLPLTSHQLPLATRPLTTYHLPLTTHHSPLTTHHSPLTLTSRHSHLPLTTYSVPLPIIPPVAVNYHTTHIIHLSRLGRSGCALLDRGTRLNGSLQASDWSGTSKAYMLHPGGHVLELNPSAYVADQLESNEQEPSQLPSEHVADVNQLLRAIEAADSERTVLRLLRRMEAVNGHTLLESTYFSLLRCLPLPVYLSLSVFCCIYCAVTVV